MGKRQRSRESSWGEFHAIQKVLDAAPEAGGQGTFGWEGRFVHSRCNITSRLKTRQNTAWVYGRQWEYERGVGRHFGQGQTSKGSTDQDTRFCAGIRNEPETLLTNFWRTTLAIIAVLNVGAAFGQTLDAVRVISRPLDRKVDLPGEFVPYLSVPIHAKITGFVQKVEVDRGSVVKEGQLLATMIAPELN